MTTHNDPPPNEHSEMPGLSDWDDHAFAAFADEPPESDADQYMPPVEEIQRMLSALAATEPIDEPATETPAAPAVDSTPSPHAQTPIQPAQLGTLKDRDLADAFMQDASRGVPLLDQAIIDLESDGDQEAALAAICRELHTLKGAAATIGLQDVGRYLHEVEDYVDAQGGIVSPKFIETLVQCADTVRQQIAKLRAGDAAPDSTHAEPLGRLDSAGDAEDSISVKASQLDRLLDMLTALVMLRNRRESRVDQLRRVNDEVAQCGARLREVERRITAAFGQQAQGICVSDHSNPLNEVGSDLLEISRNLQESYEPVAEENVAVSNFIRQFRQALVTILRMPVSGLFRRLQRAALDAARVESKRVRLEVVGADVGLERSVQERLFDPLLHIIRNAVGHGIETPEERQALGKDPVGTITLQANGTPNLLLLTIRDDGKGLNYEALRKRGLEKGLLSPEGEPTKQDLARLIFQRGFSTRETTNAVAGRGIGMDVVAETLDRMHAWVEVESEPGEGTMITLTIPLRSIIEHAMVVRAGGQLFALPMPSLVNPHDVSSDLSQASKLAETLGLEAKSEPNADDHIVVETHSTEQRGVRFQVDELIGPEEVVVRPLPAILRYQKLFSGVTLSGNGEIVLVLDPVVLTESFTSGDKRTSIKPKPTYEPQHVLVVDDSLSARRAAANLWTANGWEAVECADGISGLQMLRTRKFSAVVTDFDMPKMNGVEFIEAIRREGSFQDLPIVMLSSRRPEEMESVATRAGAMGYLQKPITEDKLEAILNQLKAQAEKASS